MSERHSAPRKPGLRTLCAAVAAVVWLSGALALTVLLWQYMQLQVQVEQLIDASSAQVDTATRTADGLEPLARKSQALGLTLEKSRDMLLWTGAAVGLVSLALLVALYRLLIRPVERLADHLQRACDGVPIHHGSQVFQELQMLQNGAHSAGETHRKLQSTQTQLEQQTHTDTLTGLANWRMFESRGEQAFFHAQRYGEALSVILLDMDHFNRINAEYGHDGGDLVLHALGSFLKEAVRASERPAARIRGEEFAVLVSHTAAQEPLLFADRLRRGIAVLEVPMPDGSLVRLTASLGVARQQTDDSDLKALMHRAEQALYRAKQTGRNRVEQAV